MVKKPTFVLFGILLLVALAACRLPQPPGYGTNDPGVSADPTPAAIADPKADDGNPSPAPRSTPGTEQSEPREGEADLRDEVDVFENGHWEVTVYDGYTDQMVQWFSNIKNPAPRLWYDFPNVDNAEAGFVAANGLEYGLDERNYCPQETCDVVVAAGEYNLITADYDFGFAECSATETKGCGILFVNVGEVTANFEQVVVNNGYSVSGRYWNGNELHQAIWGAVSHASANMLNMPTSLNPSGSTNAGANCSVRDGCKEVLWKVVITSGNHILVIAETTVSG